mmetsp:Transcript_29015/g.76712  ORF Transcript_29015/g.76712 Transcript_29015/m.76712 type:complete len:106 (+) Transcript_29015:321-638(+)
MFTNLTQHTLYLCWQKRRGLDISHAEKFGPAYLVAAATWCIMVHPTYLVLVIAKQVRPIGQPWFHVMHACTVTGYALLFAGTLWATDAWGKLAKLYGSVAHRHSA